MSSEGRTLQRGRVPGAQRQPPEWPEATAPASRRPPRAPRERRPALAALAVLLIAGGGLGAGYLVLRSGHRVGAIEISRRVAWGERIPLSAMRQVEVASTTGLTYVPWNEASQVARDYAATSIPGGTLLTDKMVAAASDLTTGKAVIGLSLKDGQLPHGLQAGDHIDIFDVSNSAPVCPGVPGQALARDAVVLAITSPSPVSGASGTDVEVALSPADAGPVACGAANAIVAVAVLPASGTAGASSGPTPVAPPPSRRESPPAPPPPSPSPSATG